MTTAPAGPPSLESLHDLVVPAGVPWWPPAPGWLVLGAVVIVAGAWLVVATARRHRSLRYRRAALAELASLRAMDSPASAARDASVLLKRTAIHVYSRERVAALHGSSWLAFLDEHGGKRVFRDEAGATLTEAAYGDASDLEPQRVGPLLDAVEGWIRAQGAPGVSGGRALT